MLNLKDYVLIQRLKQNETYRRKKTSLNYYIVLGLLQFNIA